MSQLARTVGSAAEVTRERVLRAAADLFVERGYAATSIRDISERLGMTKGALYYHFPSKEDLLSALMAPMLEAVDVFVATARETGQVSRELIGGLVEVLDAHGPMLGSVFGDSSLDVAQGRKPQMIARYFELQEILGGGQDAVAMLRARCALGVIYAGVFAPRLKDCPPGQAVPITRAERLSEEERAFLVEAAMAVLEVPG